MLPQVAIVTQGLRFDAVDDAFGVLDQRVEIVVGTDVELPKAIEELARLVTAESRKIFCPPPSMPLRRSVRCSISLSNSPTKACSASCTASSKRAATRDFSCS